MKITSFSHWVNTTAEYKINSDLTEYANSLETSDLFYEFGNSSVRMCDRESYGHEAWRCVTKVICQILAKRMTK